MSNENIVHWVEMDISSKIPPNSEFTVIFENISASKALHAGARRKGSALIRKIIIPPKTVQRMRFKQTKTPKLKCMLKKKKTSNLT